MITENTSDLISTTTFSLNPIYTYVSPSFKKILGYEPEDLIGKNNLDFIHPDDKKTLLPLLKKYFYIKAKKLINGKEPEIVEKFECRLRDKWGDYHYVESTGNIIGNEMLFVSKDNTEKKVADNKLKESEGRYRNIIDASQDSIYVLDPELRHLLVNDAGTAFVHMTRDQLLGNKLTDLFPGFEKTPFYKTLKKVLKSKKQDHVVNRFDFPDGRIGYYDVSITPMKEGILCISRDISDIKNAEEKLSENEKKYRSYMECAPDGVFICDNDGKYLEVNEAAARVTGYSKDELSTLSIKDMIPDDSLKEGFDHFNRLKTVGRSDGILKLKRKDGSTGYWNVSAAALSDHTYIGFAKDVTDQINNQEKLRESEEKYRGVVDNIGIGVSLISQDMKILFLNNKMQTWFPDVSRDEKPICYKVYNNPPRDKPCSYCPTILTLKDGKIHESITQTPTPQGIINYHIVSSPIFKEEEQLIWLLR